MRHIAGRGIRRPDHRPGPEPPPTDFRPTFDQAPGALQRAPGEPGRLNEIAAGGMASLLMTPCRSDGRWPSWPDSGGRPTPTRSGSSPGWPENPSADQTRTGARSAGSNANPERHDGPGRLNEIAAGGMASLFCRSDGRASDSGGRTPRSSPAGRPGERGRGPRRSGLSSSSVCDPWIPEHGILSMRSSWPVRRDNRRRARRSR